MGRYVDLDRELSNQQNCVSHNVFTFIVSMYCIELLQRKLSPGFFQVMAIYSSVKVVSIYLTEIYCQLMHVNKQHIVPP